jgi:hypothetical protein
VCKNTSNSICISTAVVSPEPVSPNPSASSAMKTPGNTKEDPDDLEIADELDIQMEYSSD